MFSKLKKRQANQKSTLGEAAGKGGEQLAVDDSEVARRKMEAILGGGMPKSPAASHAGSQSTEAVPDKNPAVLLDPELPSSDRRGTLIAKVRFVRGTATTPLAENPTLVSAAAFLAHSPDLRDTGHYFRAAKYNAAEWSRTEHARLPPHR